MVPTCCLGSCLATTRNATWIQMANIQRTRIRITRPYLHWSGCWEPTTSFPSLLWQTTHTHTTRFVRVLVVPASIKLFCVYFCNWILIMCLHFSARNSRSISPLLRLVCCRKTHPISSRSWKLPLRWHAVLIANGNKIYEDLFTYAMSHLSFKEHPFQDEHPCRGQTQGLWGTVPLYQWSCF